MTVCIDKLEPIYGHYDLLVQWSSFQSLRWKSKKCKLWTEVYFREANGVTPHRRRFVNTSIGSPTYTLPPSDGAGHHGTIPTNKGHF